MAAASPARTFRVEGMHCASCAGRVESLLAAQPGVERAQVNFATTEARVVGDAEESGLRQALSEAGYGLVDLEPSEGMALEAHDLGRRSAIAAALALPVSGLAMGGFEGTTHVAAQAVLTTLAVFACGFDIHRGAWRNARLGHANMDTLVSLGTLAAYGFSFVSFARGGPVFFETAAVIVALILFGRWLELRARARASDALAKLASLVSHEAVVLRDGEERHVPARDLRVGDTLVIRPGAAVPADATVVDGRSDLFEGAFTGESLPRGVGPGDPLTGGAVNGSGRLLARTERVGDDTELAAILRLVAATQASKAPVQRLADAVAGRFVPVVLVVAAITALAWSLAGAGLPIALSHAVAVLVVACPCALGLATPAAISAGSGRGAELGVLFRDAASFERARGIDTVVFDKTGTLTTGEMSLRSLHAEAEESTLLRRAAAVESASEHAIGAAIVAAARQRGLALPDPRDFRAEAGLGAHAVVEDTKVHVGSPRWLRDLGVSIAPELAAAVRAGEERGETAVLAAWEGRVRGVLCVGDTPRDGAEEAVRRLRRSGLDVALVTGDNRHAARTVADALGIERVVAEARPTDKQAEIERLQAAGHRVAFVGDGINDAAALGQADLGLALASGTDIAAESGDALLVSSDPRTSVTALALARRTYRTIRQNLGWAFVYNLAAIPAAAWGQLDPTIAAGAMALSSVSVVANSLRVRFFEPRTGLSASI